MQFAAQSSPAIVPGKAEYADAKDHGNSETDTQDPGERPAPERVLEIVQTIRQRNRSTTPTPAEYKGVLVRRIRLDALDATFLFTHGCGGLLIL
jgi:hypothetical protein